MPPAETSARWRMEIREEKAVETANPDAHRDEEPLTDR